MAIVDITELRAAVPYGKRLFGLDLGSKTIGLAICDSSFAVASPLETIRRSKFTHDANALESLIKEREIGGLILGLPRNMDNSEGPRAQSTRQFAANLLGQFDIPIAFWDERLSTVSVERMLIEQADLSRRKRAKVVDKLAASIILQGALNLMATQRVSASDIE